MTIIVSVKINDGIVLAADSAGVDARGGVEWFGRIVGGEPLA